MAWLLGALNTASIVVLAVVAALVSVAVVVGFVSKRRGRGGCAGGCVSCAMRDACHRSERRTEEDK